MGAVIHCRQRGNNDRHQRWDRIERAELFERYGDLKAQGTSQRQAAQWITSSTGFRFTGPNLPCG